MKRTRQLLATIAAIFLAAPGTAVACATALRHDGPAELTRHAREIFQRSTAIIDAEVVEPTRIVPGHGVRPARLRPIRVLKGPTLPIFLVTSGGCDIDFIRRGERVRVILTGGPELFTASQEDHGMDYPDGDNMVRFQRAIDALAGSPLPPGFNRPGTEEPPPPPRRRVTRRR